MNLKDFILGIYLFFKTQRHKLGTHKCGQFVPESMFLIRAFIFARASNRKRRIPIFCVYGSRADKFEHVRRVRTK